MKKNLNFNGKITALAVAGLVTLFSSLVVYAQDASLAPVTSPAPTAAAPGAEPAPTNPVIESTPLPAAPGQVPLATAIINPVQTTDPSTTVAAVDATAETDPVALSVDDTALLATADAKRNVRDGSLMPDDNFPTLFFTAWQHALLQEAKIGFNTRLPEGQLGSGADQAKKDPGIREVSLGGIAFANTSKWTVWLNGVRVTPNAIPQQVLDIKVSQAYIDLKWFDNYTNRIFPIRLRPQERFNLDSRIFLPGAGVEGAM